MKKKTDKQLFEHGRALYKQRRWKDSLDTHLELIANGVHASDGFYGIALIRLAHQDLANARIQLLNCVRLQPNHANAHFYLGEIARIRGEHTVAIARYRRALAAHPAHRSARKRLSALKRHLAAVARDSSCTPVKHQPARHQAVVHRSSAITHETLQPSPADLLVSRIKALTFTGRQRLAPFAMNLLVRCLIAFALVWITAQFFEQEVRSVEVHADLSAVLTSLVICGGGLVLLAWFKGKFKPGRILVLVGIVVAALLAIYLSTVLTGALLGGPPRSSAPFIFEWFFLTVIASAPPIIAAKTTVCSIQNGWIRIVSGVFDRTPIAIPLYQLQKVTVNQSRLERLSSGADVVFQYTNPVGQPATSTVRGIGKLTDLQALADQANRIANDLRLGSWRTGINYLWGPTGSVRPGLAGLVAKGHKAPQPQSSRRNSQLLQQRRRV